MKFDFDAKFFNPSTAGVADEKLKTITVSVDKGKGWSYVYSPSIVLAVNLALATQRPLFVTGRPGTGKTTLAWNVAHVLGWKYYEKVVTSRMRARDLFWTFDSLRRLSDAQEQDKRLPPRAAYVQPEVLWWALDPMTAQWRGATEEERVEVKVATDPGLPRD